MKVMVTGGAGFIGSHVAEMLIGKGHQVAVVDDLSSGKRGNVPAEAHFLQADIRTEACDAFIREFSPDALMHLAAQMDVRRSVEDPILDADINVLGLVRLVKAASEANTKKIVFSSTGGAIYGEQEVHPAPEDHPCRPVSPYGTSKLCGEHYLATFRRCGGPSCVSLRYSNVYGPRQDPHGEAGVVAIFAGRLLKGIAPIIFGDGTQTRDYVFVRDVARANLLALDKEVEGVLNIGTGVETDVNRLAALMSTETGFEGPPVYKPARPGEQHRSSVDPARAAKQLGWRPLVGLEQGLKETIAHFRE